EALLGGTLFTSYGECGISFNVTGVTTGLKANTTAVISAIESGPGTVSNTAILPVMAPTASPSFGTVVDGDAVHVFDAATDVPRATVLLHPAPHNGVQPVATDCAITPDGRTGFVTTSSNEIWVINLSPTMPAVSAA